MTKAKLGSGARFSAGKKKLMAQGYSANYAGAVMASAGRKKYGNKRFQAMAVAGRRKSR